MRYCDWGMCLVCDSVIPWSCPRGDGVCCFAIAVEGWSDGSVSVCAEGCQFRSTIAPFFFQCVDARVTTPHAEGM